MRDEKGLVNYFGSSINKSTSSPFEVLRNGQGIPLMDSSVNIPPELVLRSLPLNVELIQLIQKSMQSVGEGQHVSSHASAGNT